MEGGPADEWVDRQMDKLERQNVQIAQKCHGSCHPNPRPSLFSPHHPLSPPFLSVKEDKRSNQNDVNKHTPLDSEKKEKVARKQSLLIFFVFCSALQSTRELFLGETLSSFIDIFVCFAFARGDKCCFSFLGMTSTTDNTHHHCHYHYYYRSFHYIHTPTQIAPSSLGCVSRRPRLLLLTQR